MQVPPILSGVLALVFWLRIAGLASPSSLYRLHCYGRWGHLRLPLILSVHSEQIAANTIIGVTTDKATLFSMLRYPLSGHDQPPLRLPRLN
jgi:hypothetical protein